MTSPQSQPAEAPPAEFTDAHIHLWDLRGPLDYGWLYGDDDGLLGTQSEIAIPLWDAARFRREARFHPPAKTVHVQASDPPSDPVDETRWLVAQQRAVGLPTAIVVRAELRSADIEKILDAHLEVSSTVCGVRDMSTMGSIEDPRIRPGLRALANRGLSWEANSTWEQADELVRIAQDLPSLSIVNGHTGWPIERTPEYFNTWTDALRRLAGCANITCKVSGLGMTDHEWTFQSMQPYIRASIEVFGADRCMFGSNWPVDRIYASYDALVSGVAAATHDLSADESHAFWVGTADRTYHLS